MALLSDQDRQTVAAHLAAITHPVKILFFTQTIGAPATALIAKEVIFILEKDRAARYGIADVPALALLRGEEDTRIRFFGAPAGYEFMSLVEAVILAGTDDSGLTAESKKLIAERVTGLVDILVFVTPTCPHCPRAVTLAHRMAAEHDNIRATCVEATEFIELSRKYRVTGVPKTVVNGTIEMLGALPE